MGGKHDSDELNGLRIQQLATLRCAAYRSRSHAIVAMLVCAAAVVQAGIFLIQHLIRIGWAWRILIYASFVIAGAWGVWFFSRRAMALHREATQTRLHTPTARPIFRSSVMDHSDGRISKKFVERLSDCLQLCVFQDQRLSPRFEIDDDACVLAGVGDFAILPIPKLGWRTILAAMELALRGARRGRQLFAIIVRGRPQSSGCLDR
jgi:hypothetical protein